MGITAAGVSAGGEVAQGVGSVAGAAASIYGTYMQAKMAEKNYQMAKKAYEAEMRRAVEQDKIAAEQLQKQNMMTEADYSNELTKGYQDVWGAYNRTAGV